MPVAVGAKRHGLFELAAALSSCKEIDGDLRALALTILVAGCVGVAGGQGNVRLSVLAEHPREFQGQVVRTCGWARNAFEDHSISVPQSPFRNGGGHNPGLAVNWSSEARRTERNTPECDASLAVWSRYVVMNPDRTNCARAMPRHIGGRLLRRRLSVSRARRLQTWRFAAGKAERRCVAFGRVVLERRGHARAPGGSL